MKLKTTMKAPHVMALAAKELELISEQCAELETGLLSVMQLLQSTKSISALQSLDFIQQSLDNLSEFLNSSSTQIVLDEVDVTESIAKIKLGDMRIRLSS